MDRIKNAKMIVLLAFSATTVFSADFKDKLLHKASEQGLSKITGLLARVADVNSPGEHQQTALHAAAAAGHTKTVRNLLSVGADVNSKDNRGLTPLELAANANHITTTKVLLEAHPIYLPRLHPYIVHKMDQVALLLIRAGANANRRNNIGYTPLHLSAMYNNEALTKALLEAGARTTVTTAAVREAASGKTPLHSALRGQATKSTIRLLLVHGSPVNKKDSRAETPLLIALQRLNGSVEITHLLLEFGADPNLLGSYRTSPLTATIQRHNTLPLVNLLLEFGASPSREDIETAIDYNKIDVLLNMANRGTIIPNELLSRRLSRDQRSNIRAQMRAYEETFDEVFDKEEVPRDLQDIIWHMANG